jgi:hypothetical protein
MIKKLYYRPEEIAAKHNINEADVLRLTDEFDIPFNRNARGKRMYPEASITLLDSKIKDAVSAVVKVPKRVVKRKNPLVPSYIASAKQISLLTAMLSVEKNDSERSKIKTKIRRELLSTQAI